MRILSMKCKSQKVGLHREEQEETRAELEELEGSREEWGIQETGATGFCRPSDTGDRRPRHSRDSDHCSSALYSTRGAEPKFIVFPRRACGNSLEYKHAQI